MKEIKFLSLNQIYVVHIEKLVATLTYVNLSSDEPLLRINNCDMSN